MTAESADGRSIRRCIRTRSFRVAAAAALLTVVVAGVVVGILHPLLHLQPPTFREEITNTTAPAQEEATQDGDSKTHDNTTKESTNKTVPVGEEATQNGDSNTQNNTKQSTNTTVPPVRGEATEDVDSNTHNNTKPSDSEDLDKTKGSQDDDLNIVLFYADDWTYKTLGVFNPLVKTPHIDAMAQNGVYFPHNCVTSSVCWQSRASLVTGMYSSVHQHLKVWSDALFTHIDWNQTLFPLLRKHGYHTGFVGKWHAPLPPDAKEAAFDFHRLYYGQHWMNRDGKERHVTDLNQEDSVHYLREMRPKNQKFMLTISFYAPHAWNTKSFPDVYSPQNYTKHLYNESLNIPLGVTNTPQDWQRLPYFFNEKNRARINYHQRGHETQTKHDIIMKRYWRMVREVDDVIGNVIQELKNQNVYNHTLLLFTTDNGLFSGEHQLAGKWYPHEESVRVPLVIQDPRLSQQDRGRTVSDLTLNIDLAPTILSAANIPVPAVMQGRDLAELYLTTTTNNNKNTTNFYITKILQNNTSSGTKPWRSSFFYEWNQGNKDGVGHENEKRLPAVFALIEKQYKYVYWPHHDYEQVFHVTADPYERYDVFNETLSEDAALLGRLKLQYLKLKNLSQSGHKV